MSIILWNVRGLNHSSRISDFKLLLHSQQASIICLVETKIKELNSNRILDSLPADWFSLNNYAHDSSRRIWIFWHFHTWSCSLVHSSDQFITISAINKGGFTCMISFVYAHNLQSQRKHLWHDLLQSSYQITIPWLLMGDFYAVKFLDEKIGGRPLTHQQVSEFYDFTSKAG